ncbi:glycosyltransferase family A protein [Chryseobacterium gotjawalense]|uniref:Glycosyltransferase family A protein n=1 Tax=Chryseobacterium gotjawalense TaxID=3042315 RepID=A0ABY8RBV5_9FLAO|nr:glycosyltransferase family A protein [Chryseobacterium sp. wdc7]WHF51450.1 glycosyltransferase family A protein [Chryseobacterium sp. wdc7]
MKKLTVFTPTYNRAYCLGDLYQSLCRQASDDFLWLVIDDGSTDGTEALVAGWMEEGKIEIRYHYKENGGMHTAHNLAYENIETELNVCIDSDDQMTDDAVAIINGFWDKNKGDQYAGILGLDVYKDGTIVSANKFPENIKSGKYYELAGKYGLSGDIKFVYRTEIIKKYMPYPVFEGEIFTPLGYKYLLIDYDYEMLFLNEPLCVVDYRADGNSHNLIRQYFRNPQGFLEERKVRMSSSYTFGERLKNTVHFITAQLILKKHRFWSDSTNKLLTIIVMPLGFLYYFYLLYKLNYDRTRKF